MSCHTIRFYLAKTECPLCLPGCPGDPGGPLLPGFPGNPGCPVNPVAPIPPGNPGGPVVRKKGHTQLRQVYIFSCIR